LVAGETGDGAAIDGVDCVVLLHAAVSRSKAQE
jgi:hypothetical protein